MFQHFIQVTFFFKYLLIDCLYPNLIWPKVWQHSYVQLGPITEFCITVNKWQPFLVTLLRCQHINFYAIWAVNYSSSKDDKIKIVQMFHDHKKALEIAKFFAREHYIIKNFVRNLTSYSRCPDKGKWKSLIFTQWTETLTKN